AIAGVGQFDENGADKVKGPNGKGKGKGEKSKPCEERASTSSSQKGTILEHFHPVEAKTRPTPTQDSSDLSEEEVASPLISFVEKPKKQSWVGVCAIPQSYTLTTGRDTNILLAMERLWRNPN
ncbi:unnamed protein product, partial [Meganyctiphanes norvegica]